MFIMLAALALSSAQIQNALEMSETICPAATALALKTQKHKEVAEAMVQSLANHGYTNEQIAIIVHECTMYTKGAVAMSEGTITDANQ